MPQDLLRLQRTAGNRAVTAMLAGPRLQVQRNGSLWEATEQPSEFEKARQKCNNRFSWSDGGHWIGTGPEPDCRLTETVSDSTTLTYTWPDEESVIRAREQVGRSRNMLGYLGGGLVGVATLGTSVWFSALFGIGGGLGVSILTDYLPSVVDKVRSGDRLTITVTVSVTRSAHPWRSNKATYESKWELFNRDGVVKWRMRDRRPWPGIRRDSHSKLDQLFFVIKRSSR